MPQSLQNSPVTSFGSTVFCPWWTFFAFLILASKFTQDCCYSNEAWAKLSGLPPHKIGQCECALGEALESCLWVGQSPAGATTSAPSHPVVWRKSDGELFSVSRSNNKISAMTVMSPGTPLSNGLGYSPHIWILSRLTYTSADSPGGCLGLHFVDTTINFIWN